MYSPLLSRKLYLLLVAMLDTDIRPIDGKEVGAGLKAIEQYPKVITAVLSHSQFRRHLRIVADQVAESPNCYCC